MKLVVGLGNPGKEYENTFHNAGFLTLDILSKELFGNYWKDECGAQVCHCKYNNEEVLLAKPQSFMNCSGGPVKLLFSKYNLSLDNLIVIHDDSDISIENIRLKCGGSSAGHKGINSISNKLCSPNFIRIRVGIGKPHASVNLANYVLKNLKGKILQKLLNNCSYAAESCMYLLNNPFEKAQSVYNRKNK